MLEFKSQKIKTVLKNQLKKKNLTYEDLAEELECSVPTVKRILGAEEITLNRLLQLCAILNISLSEIEALSAEGEKKEIKFSEEQETFLAKNPNYWAYLMKLFSGKTPAEIAKEYSLTARSTDKYLIALEKQELIRVTGKQKVKPNFKDTPTLGNGPLAKNYFRSFIGIAAQFFIQVITEALSKPKHEKTKNPGRVMIHYMNVSQSTYEAWVEQQEKMLQDLRRLSEFEEKSKDPSELRSQVILLGHAYVDKDYPALKSLENVFGDIPNL